MGKGGSLGRRRFLKKGFTLLELLIVITILAILAGAIIPLFRTTRQEAQIAKAKADLNLIRYAAYLLYHGTGYWPPAVYCGCGLIRDPGGWAGNSIPGWNGPYLNTPSEPTSGFFAHDPWGYSYELYDNVTANGTALMVRSCGPDHLRGTSDDIILTITPDRTTGLNNNYTFSYPADGTECYQ